MVGLSIVLESLKNTNNKKNPQVINKATMMKPSPPPPPPQPLCRWNSPPPIPASDFLDRCFLCYQKLLPGKDIYMYKGDRAFCSVECRCKQILMDEEETNTSTGNFKREHCSLATIKAPKPSSHSSSSSSSSRRNKKGGVNRDGANGFVY